MRTKSWIIVATTMTMLACAAVKPGSQEVDAWLEEYGAFWTGSRDYDEVKVLWTKDHVGDSIRDVILFAQMQLSERREAGESKAMRDYKYWVDLQDSLDTARPKKQVGWACELDGDAHTLGLFLDMSYQVDSVSVFRWDSLSWRTIYP